MVGEAGVGCIDGGSGTVRMKVLVIHCKYQERGGEDSVFESECRLLRKNGIQVDALLWDNKRIQHMNAFGVMARAIWSVPASEELEQVISRFRPNVIHVHNTFPLVSGSIFWVASRYHVPVVQTLHNFRLLCAQAMFLRRDKVCEDCLGRLPWRGVVRRCYRGSTAQSSVLVSMLAVHRAIGTYRNKVTRYIALNEFCRNKFIQGGLPADRIVVKPNFVDLPQPGGEASEREGFLYVGRLSPEKGITTLAGAAAHAPDSMVSVIGSGPEEGTLEAAENIVRLGFLSAEEVTQAMTRALCLVMPSLWYENFPRTLVEAFACGLPVIASRLGALAELVQDGETGLLFEPGNAEDLAAKMRWAQAHPEEMRRMGEAARAEYEAKYTPEINYRQLMAIYEDAIDEVKRGGH